MNIQGYQKLTLLDYPGKTACTVFTGGCNFRCPFCHNASLVNRPTGYNTSNEEVLAYLEKRKGLLDGVCITGGEPLLQGDIKEFILKVRAMGYSVKLDTNGSLPERLEELLSAGVLDLVAMDVKNSPSLYSLTAGREVEIKSIERSLSLLKESGVEYELRTTVVEGLHTARSLTELAKWIGSVPKYFLQGYVDSGEILGDAAALGAFSPAKMRELLKEVQKYIPSAALRGVE